ncbi:enoyl-CoA hydratase/isomerase family protein [Phytohabitans kaempferiae]|uniref:Enoyl-CoA hydratase/isomerase family protein n=1 Tax=Phytohabitans kaempferiae TaxID=1620943 RepID=A0ABV6M718_9ACTN
MHRSFDEYRTAYQHVAMERRDGILEVRLHTDGGPLLWGAGPHTELGWALREIGGDPGNRVVILTGTGTEFIARLDDSWVGPMTPPKWERIYTNGKRLLAALLDIEVPVIAAVNGKATVHAELAVLSDIVLATPETVFSDAPHFRFGTVPGDGVHAVWSTLLGVNRARYFLLTGQRISAAEAKDLGVVNEVVPAAELLPRAYELAEALCQQDDITLRYTREVMTEPLRRLVAERVGHGLALEGLGAFATWPAG